ncbi:kielin/chordin-like protein isoform X1 [Procambarus clarkii]|uniref:kielin/chordin-like protein isoform X1 n=1 Tax=Procambarus clarkii TaxID=6728 RepID=UPI0037431EF6
MLSKTMLVPVSLGIVMVVMLMFTQPTRSLPISGNLSDLYSPRKRCINPEECCKYPRSSEEFVQCSNDHGCSLITCDGLQGNDNIAHNVNCKDAWACCRFLQQSSEFMQCCADHNCCPMCDKVSKGCCYNKKMYWWGSVVEELPGLCLELVCAAHLSNSPPFLTALILPVRSTTEICEGMWIDDNLMFSCVDDTGLVRAEGDEWRPDECHLCQCQGGSAVCIKLEIQCPPSPHSSCLEVPCTCCPRWECPVELTEQHLNDSSEIALRSGFSVHHYGGHRTWSIWKPLEGIKHYLSSLHGKIPSVPSTGPCQSLHDIGKTWSTNDPCSKAVCTRTGIQITREKCSGGPLHPNCLQFTPKGECCPKWNCSGCFDSAGNYFHYKVVWVSKPCTTFECTERGIELKPCTLGPQPHPYCQLLVPRGSCCAQWSCSGCFKDGKNYPLGSEIGTSDPCITLQCTYRGFERKIKFCPSTPAQENCFQYTPEGDCCKKWNCSGCFDAGKIYPLHHTWSSGPCITYECTNSGIEKTEKHCYITPAPHKGCKEVIPEGACCPEWSCSRCYKDGKYYDVGSETIAKDPCVTLRCTENGIEMIYKSCFGTPAPEKHCFEYKTEDDCCEKWNCSGCVDQQGDYYPLWQPRKIDPCTTVVCTTDGLKPIVESCHLEPRPHHSCRQHTPEGVCCPQWDCSSTTTLATIEPFLNGCVDDSGVLRQFGQEWTDLFDNCKQLLCGADGVVIENNLCFPEELSDAA